MIDKERERMIAIMTSIYTKRELISGNRERIEKIYLK